RPVREFSAPEAGRRNRTGVWWKCAGDLQQLRGEGRRGVAPVRLPRTAPVLVMDDATLMRRALSLARQGWGQTAPNPMVGAVIAGDNEIASEGFHARYG